MSLDARSQTRLFEAFAEALRQRLPEGEPAEGPLALLERSYRGLPLETLEATPPEEGARAVLSLWRLGAVREAGRTVVRVLRPGADEVGASAERLVVEVVVEDMPFLLATLTGELDRRGFHLERVLHPVVSTEREPDGRLRSMESGIEESWMHLELAGDGEAEGLVDELRGLLDEVRLVVDDWVAMRRRVGEVIEELQRHPGPSSEEAVREATEFLCWVAEDHFTLLGCQRHRLVREGEEPDLEVEEDSVLGLSRAVAMRRRRPNAAAFLAGRSPLTVYKSSRRSRVHRQVHMDAISLRRYDEAGTLIGEERIFGLFNSEVYTARTETIPLVRDKVRRIRERAGFSRGGHDNKLLVHILETYPRDELFQISEDDLNRIALGVLQVRQYRTPDLFLRHDAFERFVSCLVYLPRERFRTELRRRIQRLLEEAFEGEVTAFYIQLGETAMARIHYIVRTTPGSVPEVDVAALRARVVAATRSWKEELRHELIVALGSEEGHHRADLWCDAFPVTYREVVDPPEAGCDIEVLEAMRSSGRSFEARLHRHEEDPDRRVRLELYHRDRPLALSDVLPILENLGLRVESGMPFALRPVAGQSYWQYYFEVKSRRGEMVVPDEIGASVEETLRRVWSQELENGSLNRLVLRGPSWDQVALLRAYSRYFQQVGIAFSQRYMARTLVRNGALVRGMLDLFEALLDPGLEGNREERVEVLRQQLDQAFEEVESVDDDRILRGFLELIEATLRTSYYQRDSAGNRKEAIALKLDSTRISFLPKPRPRYEIFVYSPRFEGVHLRGGKVARGGIRWSDRPEDFRTEILGLLKAQQVKNAVIVPVGAKGGFVVKRPPKKGGREAILAEGQRCYQDFIRGLLGLTDNLVEGRVVPPPAVVRRDEDDPYLVVAADKGTATFSDLANGVAAEFGFWLGDAFASGGSVGYDHKKMGITARGAWEAVKRHFRELGKDIQQESFTVVGVGDMSGDVFGNGMLLSHQTRLLGAFNHLHVFVDPNPDPELSWQERKRLFDLPRSSWTDYDPTRISAGGGVFDRSARHLPLSPEIRQLLGLEGEKISPNDLIRALLRAPVELLWFGGIGTFVKASSERDADVGDRTNDALRIDALELSSKVIGEGANLGVTQRGRIEFALGGGKVNSDAIDNSGGVDCSDHEVNIKIALSHAESEGRIDRDERNSILETMTDEVAELVLRDNYLQTQALSLAELRHLELYDQHLRMMRALERSGRLDRQLEALPSEEDLEERARQGHGLTRPELAVLLAYSKITLYEELLASDLPDDPFLVEDLIRYFPAPLGERFRGSLEEHRLRREIIATFAANSMVNRVGPSFVHRMQAATGRSARDVARAYSITREAFELRETWWQIEALDNGVPASLQIRLLLDAALQTEYATYWFLRRFPGALEMSVAERFRPALRRLDSLLEDVLHHDLGTHLRDYQAELQEQDVPERLARRVAALRALAPGTDVVGLALELDTEVEPVARLYFRLGELLGLDWLREVAATLKFETPWQRLSRVMYRDGLFAVQATLVRQVLERAAPGAEWQRALDGWIERSREDVERYSRLLEELRNAPEQDLAMLSVAEHQLRQLVR